MSPRYIPFSFLALILATPSPADEARLAADVRQILELGWSRSLTNVKLAEQLLPQAQAAAPGDPRPAYALVLAELKQYRTKEAGQHAQSLLAAQPRYRPGLAARVWIETQQRNYPGALAAMASLAEAMADLPPDEQAESEELGRYLGRMFGYLEGPAGNDVNPEVLLRHEQQIVAPLRPFARQAFQNGRADVAGEFAALSGTKQQTVAEEKAAAEAQKQADQARLAGEKQEVAADKAGLEETAVKVRSEAESLLSEIDKKLAPLESQLIQVTARASVLNGQMIAIDADIGRLRLRHDTAVGDENAGLRSRLRFDIDRLARQYDILAIEYRSLDLEARRINAARAALFAERNGVIAGYEAEMKRLGVTYKKLSNQETKIAREEKEASEPVTGNTSRVKALSARVTALPTYQPYPLEQEKQRLLESFGR
jgi:hypothetical protein